MVEKEFDLYFRRFVNAGYGLIIISHSKVVTIKDDMGQEYQRITSTLGSTPRKIVNRLCDIIGYVKSITEKDAEGREVNQSYMFMRGTSKFEAGARFKYIAPYIKFDYDNIVKALHDAIDEEAKHGNENYVTNDKINNYETEILDFDEIFKETQELISKIMEKDEKYSALITESVENRLGKGRLLRDANRVQVEQVNMILNDLKNLIAKGKIEI